MDIINLTEKDLKELILICNFTYESRIYRYCDTAFKIFKTKNDLYDPKYNDIQLMNKFKKIEILNSINFSNHFVTPQKLIAIDNKLIGYTMKYIEGITLNDLPLTSKKRKIYLLNQIKNIIYEAHKYGIILNDINLGNFIKNNDYLFICDLDNCIIDNLGPDTYNINLLSKYLSKHGFSEDLDFFLFNLLYLNLIYNKSNLELMDKDYIINSKIYKNKKFKFFYDEFINFENSNYNSEELCKIIAF